MRTSMIKRTVLMVIVIVFAVAAYSPTALCTSPSPSPTDSASTSPTATPDGSEQSEESAEPTQSSGFQTLRLNDRGTEVMRVQMRLRDLGYFNYRATGKFFSKTESAVREFQQINGLDQDGRVGPITYDKLFITEGLIRKPLSPSRAPVYGPQNENPEVKGTLGEWETINAAFTVGMSVKITDVNKPSITFNLKRTGGTNLATVEVPAGEDYDKYIESFGGDPNWEKRSVLVNVGGVDYAAALFGNPGGADTISGNTMAGHTVLYFYGSTTDVLGFEDKEALRMVMRAAGEPVKYPDEP